MTGTVPRRRFAPELERLVESLRSHGVGEASVAFVLGSGLSDFAERLEGARRVPYGSIDGMPRSAVPGHAGELVLGDVRGARVVVQSGRIHLYEGYDAQEVTRAVRAFAALGVGALVLTNAAGGMRRDWPTGTLMRIVDHVNLQGTSPLTAEERGFGSPYDDGLGRALHAAASEASVTLEAGVYAGVLGPSYETPAEVRYLRRLGGDAVGMSTVAEALAAHASGMRVAGVSCITNLAAGLSGHKLSHAEVVETTSRVKGEFCDLLECAVPRLVE